jgi:hypothetical protein
VLLEEMEYLENLSIAGRILKLILIVREGMYWINLAYNRV